MPISNGKVLGDQIVFTAGDARYTGRVNGNAIEGIAQTSDRLASDTIAIGVRRSRAGHAAYPFGRRRSTSGRRRPRPVSGAPR